MAEDGPRQVAGVAEGLILAGKYRVDRVLGAGGMGVVVAAHHIGLDEKVAIKLLLPEMLSNAEAVNRFSREARNAVKIKGEHMARVFDVGTLETGATYMVMEFLEGGDMHHWLQQRGPLPFEEAVDFVLQTCEVIAEAHSLGIIHRDLKPANLFCVRRADGRLSIKVLDFGISKVTHLGGSLPNPGMTHTGALMGSPFYMSPEQMQSSSAVDTRTDIWALGAIIQELVTGKVPFPGDTLLEVARKIAERHPHDVVPKHRLSAIVSRGACRDHQRKQVLFTRMTLACRWRVAPRGELGISRFCVLLDDAREPGVERLRGWAPTAALVGAHVVKAQSAADEEHALFSKRCECSPDCQMCFWIQARLKRELHGRDLRIGIGDLQRNEDSVVEPALRLGRRFDSRGGQQSADAFREVRRSRGSPRELVGVRRKAGVVEEQRRMARGDHCGYWRFPVRGDDEQRTRGLRKRTIDPTEPTRELVKRVLGAHRPVHEEARAGAVRDEERGHLHAAARAGFVLVILPVSFRSPAGTSHGRRFFVNAVRLISENASAKTREERVECVLLWQIEPSLQLPPARTSQRRARLPEERSGPLRRATCGHERNDPGWRQVSSSSRILRMPRGRPSPKLAITVDPDVHGQVLAAAAAQGMSISAWMTDAARRALRREEGLAAVGEWEAQHGQLTDKEMEEARSRVRAAGARRARARRSA